MAVWSESNSMYKGTAKEKWLSQSLHFDTMPYPGVMPIIIMWLIKQCQGNVYVTIILYYNTYYIIYL